MQKNEKQKQTNEQQKQTNEQMTQRHEHLQTENQKLQGEVEAHLRQIRQLTGEVETLRATRVDGAADVKAQLTEMFDAQKTFIAQQLQGLQNTLQGSAHSSQVVQTQHQSQTRNSHHSGNLIGGDFHQASNQPWAAGESQWDWDGSGVDGGGAASWASWGSGDADQAQADRLEGMDRWSSGSDASGGWDGWTHVPAGKGGRNSAGKGGRNTVKGKGKGKMCK